MLRFATLETKGEMEIECFRHVSDPCSVGEIYQCISCKSHSGFKSLVKY